jgi:hypothetical protein
MRLRAEPAHSTARCPLRASRLPILSPLVCGPRDFALETTKYTVGHDDVKSTSLRVAGPSLKPKGALSTSIPAGYSVQE